MAYPFGGNDDQGSSEHPTPARRELDGASDRDGGGMRARWEARLRLQSERRKGERRLRTRGGAIESPDRRAAS